ncbi:MAG: T9SS type A sorting domain-containing protein [Bacteroidetes bacterium]|nr:T9SS type A sorting domain-containing protein [Bacteroidota bacterium]
MKKLLFLACLAATLQLSASSFIISKQASDTTVCLGSSASFSVEVSSTDSVIYNWEIDRGSGFIVLSGTVYSGLTTKTLSINAVLDSIKTYKFRCVVNDTIGDTLQSTQCQFKIPAGISKISQTEYTIYCQETIDTMSITATGVVSYQWKWDNGSGFVNMMDDADYSGTNTRKLTLKNPNSAMNNYKYKCMLTSACGLQDSSNTINFTGVTTCYFSSDPTDVTMCSSSGVSKQFSCGMYGPHFSARWQVDSAGTGFRDISNSDPLYFSPHNGNGLAMKGNPPSYMDGNKYRCVMVSICSEDIFSGEATLHVGSSTIPVTSQPKSVTALTNSDATFSIAHTGTNVSYQWQVNTGGGFADITNNATYQGATSATLKVTNVSNSLNGYSYRCKLSNTCASTVTSSTATLSVFDFKICMVTIEDEKNQIVFQKPTNMTTVDSFFIYREGTVTDQFDLIGKLLSTDYSAFIDATSKPRQQAEIYRMAIKFKDGSLSTMTTPHQTMLLTTNRGVNNSTWNLIWNKYTGISVASYDIYRGVDSTALSYLATVSGSNSIFTDNAAPAGDIYYQIVILGNTCTPAQGGPVPAGVPHALGGASYTAIKSNINRTKDTASVVTGMLSLPTADFQIYPNPSSGNFTIDVNASTSVLATISITNVLGETVFSQQQMLNGEQKIPVALGVISHGMYLVKIQSGDALISKRILINQK